MKLRNLLKEENNKKSVTIEKWFTGKDFFYWIVDENGEGVDGFSKKYQALDAIKRWNLTLKDKKIKIRK